MTLANKVANALGLSAMPEPADAALSTRQDLDASPALIESGPNRFEGRKLGILVSDGTDAFLLQALQNAITKGRRVLRANRPESQWL